MNVYFSLGSNLGNRQELLELAFTLLNKRIGNLVSRSSFYETEPWGFSSKNSFLNVCCLYDTKLTPQEVLKETQQIEKELGRKRKSKNREYHDRPIDIDLLFYDQLIINTPALTLPHPLMHERKFVLEPLKEIAPDVIHPVLKESVIQLLEKL
ncbi:MAG: 2-amino-4-hydroxy-6-hydroxymethyldihydropteridine diphosphokinase [Bacteroidaceae bacterium]|nr:2-amino-4-hydroxy-6-hydroxymethyldihydropteridine diphosphokinase [Bacteroidaceae bacterium]